jgi:hypothetical protein
MSRTQAYRHQQSSPCSAFHLDRFAVFQIGHWVYLLLPERGPQLISLLGCGSRTTDKVKQAHRVCFDGDFMLSDIGGVVRLRYGLSWRNPRKTMGPAVNI